MRVGFTGKSVQLDDGAREYVEKKLQRLSRHFSSAREASVAHRVQRNWHIVEVQLDLDGVILRGEARAAEPLQAIDQVADKLEEQVRRLKSRMRHHKGRANAATAAVIFTEVPGEAETPEADEPVQTIVRRKQVTVNAMTADEAALQMELVHHDFFAFLNAETGQPNILYRRRDGDYGLLELDV